VRLAETHHVLGGSVPSVQVLCFCRAPLQNLAVFTVESKWRPNKPLEAKNCYGTTSIEHPAVQVGPTPAFSSQACLCLFPFFSCSAAFDSRKWLLGSSAACGRCYQLSLVKALVVRPCNGQPERAPPPLLLQMISMERGRYYMGGKVEGLQLPTRVFPCATPAGEARPVTAAWPAPKPPAAPMSVVFNHRMLTRPAIRVSICACRIADPPSRSMY
jgi:hypothetical protein